MERPPIKFEDFVMPSQQDMLDAVARIAPFIHHTPVLTSTLLDQHTGVQLYFKCDNFQKAGAYKIRGATNALLQLTDEQKANGVATHSSGNFAQALALAAKQNKVHAYIVMPDNAPKVKIAAVRDYGAEVILCPSTLHDREQTLAAVSAKTGATILHPSNDTNVIIGQGTLAYELLQQVSDLDYIISPVGGGGVIGGTCLACHYFSPRTLVVGAEPFNADDAYRSLIQGEILDNESADTIADGLRTKLGDKNFPIIYQFTDEIIRVTEASIKVAMRLVWERMKIIIEPSSATSLAAVMTRPEKFQDKKVGLIITGGNVSLDAYFDQL